MKNKRILFIAPVFYKYHTLIIEKLESFGAHVQFFPERKYNVLFKIINNLSQVFLKKYQKKHYQQILNNSKKEEYDYLYVIRGFMMPVEFIEEFKKRNPNAKLIMYQWDPNSSNPFFSLINYFDCVFSFDYEDCKQQTKLIYSPLFYTDDILECRNNEKEYKYDFFIMGYYQPERYTALLEFKKLIAEKKLKGKLFLYMPKSMYLKSLLKGFKLDKEIISFNPLSRIDYLKLLNDSKIIVDINKNNQTGLAIRIIEAIGAGKKILTNNKYIKNELIYTEDRISLFDSNNLKFSDEFLDTKINKDSALLTEGYSLTNWLLNQFKD